MYYFITSSVLSAIISANVSAPMQRMINKTWLRKVLGEHFAFWAGFFWLLAAI